MVTGPGGRRLMRLAARDAMPTKSGPACSAARMGQPAPRILGAHQTLGNQAMQRLLHSKAIQAKLAVSQPGDPYEQEADRVAAQVLRMSEPAASERVTAPASGETPRIQRRCTGCEEE